MTDSQIYRVYLIKSNNTDNALFLFNFKQAPNFRPKVGDVLTNPLTLQSFKVLIDEFDESEVTQRITDDLDIRITDDFHVRIVGPDNLPGNVTHSYYVTPVNNPNRISSYSTSRFSDDQALKQLFK